jgi:hypothetical protein
MRQGCKINWASDRIDAPEVGNCFAITNLNVESPITRSTSNPAHSLSPALHIFA